MSFRYIPNTDADRKEMLSAIGVASVEDLFDTIPEPLRYQGTLQIPPAQREDELMLSMGDLARKNATTDEYAMFLGAGAYDHYIPSVVPHLVKRSEFYTAYTPYQPEISQGILQAIFEYQTMISHLTGLPVVNASMYDGQTALAEAATMAAASTGKKKILVSETIHPESRQVIQLYCKGQGIEVEQIPWKNGQTDLGALQNMLNENVAAMLIQYPNFFGGIEDLQAIREIIHAQKALFVISTNPIALGMLRSPGDFGADIVVGEGQPLGNPLSFGGPYLGFFATTNSLMRKIPGRIVGQTFDAQGKRGYVLTLQAREQHIRREKATSNICSNQALNALTATIYLSALGKTGFRELSETNMQKAHYLFDRLHTNSKIEFPFNTPFFNEFVIQLPQDIEEVNAKLLKRKIIGGYDLGKVAIELERHMLIAVTEKRTKQQMDQLVQALEEIL
ncbi:glycine dehydrogenase (aminomethyl-transferring) [Desulfuribacillus stibiiarsenatis]|uniref:Probable glycine dehydrogenase (decarboxylating) subunit 1 n=1 Tax=Desulfuribacillus stibiiarsenatis TaxID=1390249 RepID=A0A1E5L6L3_9FIRM|nr:aminomethyl-transferring glycine dehydrogenase subunit GcvPA [Desulfuribacillus stibiiarsenatis]OEH85634.1 glycine dehydrogenase (aminomethyl-transferring) [Desulfuribacillus stibiiarsenatis]